MRFDIDPQFAGMTEHMDHIDDKMLQLEAQNKFKIIQVQVQTKNLNLVQGHEGMPEGEQTTDITHLLWVIRHYHGKLSLKVTIKKFKKCRVYSKNNVR